MGFCGISDIEFRKNQLPFFKRYLYYIMIYAIMEYTKQKYSYKKQNSYGEFP
jgi:hypothetical protein